MKDCELASDEDQETVEMGPLEDSDVIIVHLVFFFLPSLIWAQTLVRGLLSP